MSINIPSLSGITVDADKDWNAKKITNLGAPTTSTDAARKDGVDTVQTNLDTHTVLTASVHGSSASGFEDKANKNAASGYAGLDANKNYNTANLLASITPTFSGFTTNPGTNAEITSELSTAALTTAGVVPQNTNCYVTYDLGASKRVQVFVYALLNVDEGTYGLYVEGSDDAATWHEQAHKTTTAADRTYFPPTVIMKCQYVRLTFYKSAVGSHNLTKLRIHCALI